MKLFFRLFFLIIISPVWLFGQGEANNWYFGFNAGLQFNADGTVNPLNDGQLNTFEGCATISDPLGNLLFYTDGATVYNRNHAIMDNGENLFGGPSSTQSAIIVPWPENPNLYYIFTVQPKPVDQPGVGLNYSVVDISLDGGNGSIIQKNTNLLYDCAEKITAVVKDCRANSLWLIALSTEDESTRRPFNTYHAYEINPSGLSATPVLSTFNSLNITYVGGYLKLSPDGTKLASANMDSGLFVYDFDTDTGIVSNQQEITVAHATDRFPYGIEFSPSSEYLYVHASNHLNALTGHTASLFQYDLESANISASQFVLDPSRDHYRAALQLGPNGKVYRALSETYLIGSPYLGVIHSPDEQGAASNYEHNAINLGNNSGQGLPPFVQSFFDTVFLVPEDTDTNSDFVVCEGEPINLTPQFIAGATYTWAKDGVVFANPENHTFTIPSASMEDAGTYEVTILRPRAEQCPITGELSLVVDPKPTFEDRDIFICDSDEDNATDGITAVDLRQLENRTDVTYSYYLSELDRDNDQTIDMPQEYRNIVPFDQIVYYKIVNAQSCIYEGEIEIHVRESPIFSLEESYTICTDNPNLTIEGPMGFDEYEWLKLDGNQESVISNQINATIVEEGNYVLQVSSNHLVNGEMFKCTNSSTFIVLPLNQFEIDDVDFGQNQLEILVSAVDELEYSLDGINYQESNTFSIPDSDELIVYVKQKSGCTVMENVTDKYEASLNGIFPKFFTPNGDNINDFWQYVAPMTPGIEPELKYVQIYDRYGTLVYNLNPDSNGWNGTFKNKPLPSSDYWYKAIFDGELLKFGHFALKR